MSIQSIINYAKDDIENLKSAIFRLEEVRDIAACLYSVEDVIDILKNKIKETNDYIEKLEMEA